MHGRVERLVKIRSSWWQCLDLGCLQETLCWGLGIEERVADTEAAMTAKLYQALAVFVHLPNVELIQANGPWALISTNSGIEVADNEQ